MSKIYFSIFICMIQDDNFVSISEVRDNTTTVFKTLPKAWRRFVMSRNKPVWVMMSMDEYNATQIPIVEPDQWEIDAIEKYEADKKAWTIDEREDAFEFLKKLQNGDI